MRDGDARSGLLTVLAEVGRRFGPGDAAAPARPVPIRAPGPVPGSGPAHCSGAPSGSGAAVLCRVGSVVVKAHTAGTDGAGLALRLAAATDPAMAGILLAPVTPRPLRAVGRWVSVWPYGTTVPTDPTRVPWAGAGALLAALHATTGTAPALGRLPASPGPYRPALAVAALDRYPDSPHATLVRSAWQTLPGWVRAGEPAPGPATLVHGDWHLGQLIGVPGGWRLADIDDLGTASPLWDLGRLATFRALGVVREAEFRNFLDGYWAAGGPALRPGSGDPATDPAGWATLDVIARAYLVATTARRLARVRPGMALSYADAGLLAACARLAGGVGLPDWPALFGCRESG